MAGKTRKYDLIVSIVTMLLLFLFPSVDLYSQADTPEGNIIATKNGDLISIDPQTGMETPTALNREGWYFTGIDWSPDGSRISFSVILPNYTEAFHDSDIFVADLDGSNLIRLTENDGDNLSPQWSPDGQKLAFTSNRTGNWEVYIVNSDRTDLTNITHHEADDGGYGGRAWGFAWSPDGQQIAFVSDRENRILQDDGSVFVLSQNIFLVNVVDPQQVTNLTSGIHECGAGHFYRNLVWSPVQDDLFFAYSCTGNWNILRLDVRNTLTSLNEPVYIGMTDDSKSSYGRDGLDITQDGMTMVFVVTCCHEGGEPNRPSNIFVMDISAQEGSNLFSKIMEITHNEDKYVVYANPHWYSWLNIENEAEPMR